METLQTSFLVLRKCLLRLLCCRAVISQATMIVYPVVDVCIWETSVANQKVARLPSWILSRGKNVLENGTKTIQKNERMIYSTM